MKPSAQHRRALPVALAVCRGRFMLLLLAFGCRASEALIAPADTGDGSGTGGTVQRASLTVLASGAPEDSAVLNALAFGAVPPSIDVTIQRQDGSGLQAGQTDALGHLTFDSLLPGTYRVSAVRPLTDIERNSLPATIRDVTGFGGGTTVSLGGTGATTTLTVVAGRRGSLVISEFWNGWLDTPPIGTYFYAGFVEIFNNGDTVAYLDGKHLAVGYDYDSDSPFEPCAVDAPYRRDSLGIWAFAVYRFPGAGHTYAVFPGETRVIALDAVDHRPFAPNGIDLSGANFEMIGPSDVDNPSAANLTNLGPNEMVRGHGMLWTTTAVPVIADTFDFAALATSRTSYFNTPYVRIPAARIIDVAAFTYDHATRPTGFSFCSDLIHPRFDAAPADLLFYDDALSAQRRVLTHLPGAPALLQRTRTSARDFERAAPTPGWIP